ncbi:MAG: hypothetical protein SOW55_00345 [Bacilli bacterium]|nr:hypothetical protein [Bacillales bacterium]MDY2574425.1 hypothetical protein [Bacilli bacterium]
MKKKVLTLISIFILVISIPITILSFAFFAPCQFDKSFYGGLKIKLNRISSIEEKKIVVIGGSSVAFGYDSKLVEKETGISFVNFGLYANLGTKYMLDLALDSINEDDIVIIAPEQDKQSLSNYFNGESVWYSLDGNFSYINKIDKNNYTELLSGFFPFLSNKYKSYKNGSKPNPSGVYNVDSFDSYGDIVYPREANVMVGNYDSSSLIDFNINSIDLDFIDYLNRYAKKVEDKKASVYFTYSPINKLALIDDETSIYTYHNYLKEKLSFKVLGNPLNHILEPNWFYDSNFHLNTNGSVLYTLNFIQELKLELNDDSPITTLPPSMPNLKDFEEEVNTDYTQYFVFEESSEGINIISLTEDSKKMDKIVIPDEINGKKVIKISKGAITSSIVKQIVFGKNIKVVEDNWIGEDNQLESIYITSKDPNSFNPSNRFLANLVNVKIYVPKESYNDYILDYFWGFHSSSIKGYDYGKDN